MLSQLEHIIFASFNLLLGNAFDRLLCPKTNLQYATLKTSTVTTKYKALSAIKHNNSKNIAAKGLDNENH